VRSTALSYEDIPKYDSWLKTFIIGLTALTLIPGLIFLFFNTELAITMFALTVFDGLLFYFIIPRRFQIYEDRLRIQLGGPLAFNLSLENINKARQGSRDDIFIYWGIKFGTSTSNVVEIVRKRGMNIIITPANYDEFLNQLNRAIPSPTQANAI
jgi:hypothetical protein